MCAGASCGGCCRRSTRRCCWTALGARPRPASPPSAGPATRPPASASPTWPRPRRTCSSSHRCPPAAGTSEGRQLIALPAPSFSTGPSTCMLMCRALAKQSERPTILPSLRAGGRRSDLRAERLAPRGGEPGRHALGQRELAQRVQRALGGRAAAPRARAGRRRHRGLPARPRASCPLTTVGCIMRFLHDAAHAPKGSASLVVCMRLCSCSA